MPRCIYRGSSLRWRKREKKDKKIGSNENQKPWAFSPWTWKRRGELKSNSNQLSAMPDDKALKCFPPSFPFRSFLTFFFFLYRGRDWKSLWAWQIALDSINPSLVLVILQVGPIVSSNHYWPPSFCELDRIVRMNHFLTVCGPLSHFYFLQFVSVQCRRICRGLC